VTEGGSEEIRPEDESMSVDRLHRGLARVIDLLIFLAAASIDSPVGPLAGLLYLLIADGFLQGRSLGKLLIGIQVVRRRSGRPAGFRGSILRNLPIAFAGLLALIPLVGWVLFLTLGAGVLAFESYMVVTDEEGARAGDVLADTRVVPFAKGSRRPQPSADQTPSAGTSPPEGAPPADGGSADESA